MCNVAEKDPSTLLRRIKRLISIGKKLADPSHPLGMEARKNLIECIRLPPQGIDLALREYLEINPTDDELSQLMNTCGFAERCHVILSANVCVAAFRAIALAVATSEEIWIKPSRRDPVLAKMIARELSLDLVFCKLGGRIHLTDSIHPIPGDQVHVYGSDETISEIQKSLPSGVIFRGHGSGFGLAVLGNHTNVEIAARSLAKDIVVFDQQGCLSPRILIIEGSDDRVQEFVESFGQSMKDLGEKNPRGKLFENDLYELTNYRSTLQSIGTHVEGENWAIGIDHEPTMLILPPACRVLHIVKVETWNKFCEWIQPFQKHVTTLGMEGDISWKKDLLNFFPSIRKSPFGFMQKPRLDGPVDLRK